MIKKFLIKNNFSSIPTILKQSLRESDPLLANLIESETLRIKEGINLIPSENYPSKAVLESMGSILQSKYSEGYPGARYYGGNQFIDQIELLCQSRSLAAFNLNPEEWAVNVQALSGSPANFYVYSAVMNPGERIMGLDLPHGGHLSHGFQTDNKKISMVSKYFDVLPYRCDAKTGLIDYDDLESLAQRYRPKVLIAGASAYSRLYDYERMSKIAKKCGAYLLSDIAHISGLISAETIPSPFQYSDIVTTTTHKGLRGPRGALIFYRKGIRSTDSKGKQTLYDLQQRIDQAVFPGHQGGPHNHTIAGIATAMHQACQQDFKEYQRQVLLNSQALCKYFLSKNYTLVSGGTDNHLMLLDLKSLKIDGARVQILLDHCNIFTNKNSIPGDKSAMVPGGLRVGSPAMTTRGLKEAEFKQVAEFVHRGILLAIDIHHGVNKDKKLADFQNYLLEQDNQQIKNLKNEVIQFSSQFETIS